MKIAIDISHVVYGTGVSVYTKELVNGLLKIDTKNEYLLYAGVLRRKKDLDNYIRSLKGKANFVVHTLPIPPSASDLLWNYLRLFPIELLIGKVDVLHVSDWTEPPAIAPKVTTVHDLSPILYPALTHPRIRRVFERKMKLIKNNSDVIIVPSLTIEKELLNLGIDAKRIHTIPEAPSSDLLSAPHIDIRKRFGITDKFILMVGTAERKNHERAIEAFKNARLSNTQLVIAGQASQNESNKDIIYTGFISTHELASLYREAQVFLYPSLYEGFGLTILEAFALGCPVVTSNLGSMQEVAADSAVTVNPYDTKDIEQGILKAISQRNTYVKRGLARVKDFSWEKTAQETLKIYENIYAKR